jgi:uncharacterized membrane protein YbaN (DUF454 family)
MMVERRWLPRLVVLIVGWALVLLGTVGLALPVLQGVLLILLGLCVLSRESRTARRLSEQLRARHRGLDAAVERAKASWGRALGRWWPEA